MQDTCETESQVATGDCETGIDKSAIKKLVDAESQLSEDDRENGQYEISRRYQILKNTADCNLTTATIRGAETVKENSVTLRIEHEDERKYLTVYKQGHGNPTIQDLLSLVSVDKLGDLWGEEFTMFPRKNGTVDMRGEIEGSSGILHRAVRKARLIALSTGTFGMATRTHPYESRDKLAPTPRGLAILCGLTSLSVGSLGLLASAVQFIPEALATSLAVIVPFYLILAGLLSISSLLFVVTSFCLMMAGGYLLVG